MESEMAKGSMELNHSGGSLKSNQSKAELVDFNKDSPLSSPDFSSSEELAVADDEDLVKSSDDLMAKVSMGSIVSGVSSTSDWPRFRKYFKNKLFFIVRLMGSLYFGINYVSVKWDNSHGCAAHVKETPHSPEEKPEDLIGADIDSVRDDEDLVKSSYNLMAKGSMESIDSGVSFKSDRSNHRRINFKDSSSLSGPDFSSSEEEHIVADDEDWIEFLADPDEMNQELSSEVRLEHR